MPLTEELARRIRISSLEMVHRSRASHIGSALSIADILALLYGEIMRHDPRHPDWPERDRFVLSKGHACVALYAVLAECGYFAKALLEEYGMDHSLLMNHVSHHLPGVEFSTGSLGHGLPFILGKALAARIDGARHHHYVLVSDGELDEGSNWEAILFAGHHRLDNLTLIVDANGLQSLDRVERVLDLEPLAEKLRAFRWQVREVDGNNHKALHEALGGLEPGKPQALIARTIKGKGVRFMENQVLWHYRNPDEEQLRAALEEIRSGHAD